MLLERSRQMSLRLLERLIRSGGFAFLIILFVCGVAFGHGDELEPAPMTPPVAATIADPELSTSEVRLEAATPPTVSIYLSAATHELEMGPIHCWGCHRKPNLGTDVGRLAMSDLCLDCHKEKQKMDLENEGTGVGSKGFRLFVDRNQYLSDAHSRVSCVQCHEGAQSLPHIEKTAMDCASCHGPFECPQSAENHPNTSCSACHIEGKVEIDPKNGILSIKSTDENASKAHVTVEWKACNTCHFVGNKLKTPSILIGPPARPFLSSANLTLVLGLLLFCLGALIQILRWGNDKIKGYDIDIPEYLFSGLGRAIFTRKIKRFINVIFFDIFLQRKLLYASPLRWALQVFAWWPILIFVLIRWTVIEGIILEFDSQAVFNVVSDPGVGLKILYGLLALIGMAGIFFGLMLRFFGEKIITIGMPLSRDKGYTLIGEDIPAAILCLGVFGTIFIRLLPVTNNGLMQALHSLSWYGWIGAVMLLLIYSPFSSFIRGIFGPLAEFLSDEADVSLGIKRGIGSSLKETYPRQD